MPIFPPRFGKWGIALLVCAGLLQLTGLPLARAQAHGLEVRVIERELYGFQPRQAVTLAFSVQNRTGAAAEFEPNLILPHGWKRITTPLPFSLEPNERTVNLVSFLIPEDAAAGEQTVTYAVQQRFQPAIRESAAVNLRVLPVLKLQAFPKDAPDAVASGEEYAAVFVLRNGGNVPLTVDFQLRSSLGNAVTPDAGRITLAAGEAREVVAAVKTAPARRLVVDVLTLDASADDAKLTERASRAVKLLPRLSGLDRYRTVPATLTLRYLTQERDGTRQAGWQTEVSGQGALDESGTQRIGFLVRQPDRRTASAFGMLDESRLEYSGQNASLALGDHAYSLSPLTEAGRYGRGARGAYQTAGGIDLKVYRMEDRDSQRPAKQSALGLGLVLNDETRIGLNYLSKGGAVTGQVLGLRVQLHQGLLFAADGEVAHGLSGGGSAVHGQVRSSGDTLRYHASLLRAPPDFRGYYRDQAWLNGGFDYLATPQWTARGHLAWQRSNLARAAGRTAPDERRLTLGADYLLPSGNRLTLDYFGRRTVDLQPQPTADAVHHALRLGAIQRFKTLSLTVSGERGYTDNKLQGERFATALCLLAAGWQATDRLHYSAQLSRDDNTYSNARQPRQTSAGAGMNYDVAERTRLSLYLQGTFAQQDSTSYNLSLQHEFASGQSVQMMLRRTAGSTSQNDAMISYSIPFDLPVARRKNLAPVQGRLFDAANGIGVADAALDLGGLIAVTDAQGRFSFPAAQVGKQYLSMLRAGNATGMVPVRPLPMEIEVQESSDNELDVAMVRAGSVAGRVMVYDHAEQPPTQWLVATHGMAGILVILRSGEREVRRLTDGNGHFRIAGLPAGKWAVSVSDEGMPSGHRLVQQEIGVEISPDQEATVNFRLVPRPRKVQMLAPLVLRGAGGEEIPIDSSQNKPGPPGSP